MSLGKLNELNLNGNQIKYIENLEKLPMLRKLNLSKNKIESLGSLGIPPKNTSIEILDLSRNLFSIDCLENLIFELQNIPDLKEIDFTDNEITKNKDYKPKILIFKEIIRLDGLETKGILRNHLELLKTTNNYETLIEKTKKETLENLRENEELKRRLNERIDEKEEEIDRIYEKYELTMKKYNLSFFLLIFLIFFIKKKVI